MNRANFLRGKAQGFCITTEEEEESDKHLHLSQIKVKRGSIAVTALPIRFPWLPIVAHIRTRRESEGG